MEETQEEFLNLCMPREENPDGRKSTCTAWSAEGARAWSDLFVRNILPRQTLVEEDPVPPSNDPMENNIASVAAPNSART